MSLCVLHVVQDALNKPREEGLGAHLKISRRSMWSLWERWGWVCPKIVGRGEAKAYALLTFIRY